MLSTSGPSIGGITTQDHSVHFSIDFKDGRVRRFRISFNALESICSFIGLSDSDALAVFRSLQGRLLNLIVARLRNDAQDRPALRADFVLDVSAAAIEALRSPPADHPQGATIRRIG